MYCAITYLTHVHFYIFTLLHNYSNDPFLSEPSPFLYDQDM